MPGTDLEVRTADALATLNNREYLAQIERLLPESVPLRKFVQVAATAIRTTPDLTDPKVDANTLFGSLIRCAQDGLFPDGREAALVAYKGKVNYLPMIGGLRKVAADYGWMLRTQVVYANDTFEYSEEPPSIKHMAVRPGTERGDIVYAYAIALHRDGRRMQLVFNADDVKKRQAKAQTQAVWNEWREQMWMKTVGKALVKVLPISDRDLIDRITADQVEPAAAAALLYGPDGAAFRVTSAPPADALDAGKPPADEPSKKAAGVEDGQQADEAAKRVASSVPDDDEEDEPLPPAAANAGELAAAAEAVAGEVVPSGGWKGMTLAQVAEAGDTGVEWLGYALRHPSKYDDAFVAALETYVQGALPELWAAHTEWAGQKAAA